MKATATVTITAIRRKVSVRENIYHEIDIIEHLENSLGEEVIPPREWKKLFYNNDIPTNVKEDLVNKKVDIEMAFYPMKRMSGDKEYTNINTHIVSIKGL